MKRLQQQMLLWQQSSEEQKVNVSRETRGARGAEPMEERRIPTQKPISETITIPVAEYHFLTKAATLLEIILADKSYSPNTVVAAVRTVVQEMVQQAEAGAAE